MKKTVDGKKYIQVKDILFIENNRISVLPVTLYKKILMRGKQIFSSKNEEYIEIETKEESDFFDSLYYIYDLSYVGNLSYNEMLIEIKKLDKIKTKDIKLKAINEYKKLTLQNLKSSMEEDMNDSVKDNNKKKRLFKRKNK